MSAATEVLARAYAMRGTPYVLGAEGLNACDCSGLIYRIFVDSGHGNLIDNDRKKAAGYARYFANQGMFSSHIADALPGDLIVYTHGSSHVSHIGVYVGNGRVISALTTTGVTETRYNGISVTFAGVCLVPFSGTRNAYDDPGDDGDEDPADPSDTDYNDQPPNVPEIDGNIGYTPNVSGEWNLPIRRMEITFPTPTDAMFKLTLGDVFDQAFLGIDPTDDLPPSTPPFVPPDDGWWTETIPVPVTSPGFGSFPLDGEAPIGDITSNIHKFLSRNEDGQFVGSGGGAYSSVGIKSGFVFNVPFTQAHCGGIGPGAYTKWEDREEWILLAGGTDQGDPPYEDHPYGFLRSEIINNGVDYEIIVNDWTVSGYVPSMKIGVAYGTPTPGRYDSANYFGVLNNPEPHPPNAIPTSTRTVDFGTVVMPWSVWASTEDMWLVVTPGWEAQRDGYYCDPVYSGGPAACIAQGPRCTGEGNSGVFALTAFNLSSRPVYAHLNNLTTGVTWHGPAPDGQSMIYRTQYPYMVGTLTVQWQGVTLTDAHEYDPANGLFILSLDPRDQTEYLTVTYRRADIVTTNPYVPGLPPGEPGSPYTPPPGNPNGSPYRPANQRQFGWGTIYDSTNCNMACAAMALDRHTLGTYTKFRGDPLNTPPNMRSFSGETGLGGTSQANTTTAWSNGWGESWTFGGPVAWSTMVANIASGRGSTLFGRYSYMADHYKKSRTFDGPHAIYINEQLADGSFWGYDPIVGYPIIYPYDVLRTYAESYYGFSGRVHAGFTRVTPNI